MREPLTPQSTSGGLRSPVGLAQEQPSGELTGQGDRMAAIFDTHDLLVQQRSVSQYSLEVVSNIAISSNTQLPFTNIVAVGLQSAGKSSV